LHGGLAWWAETPEPDEPDESNAEAKPDEPDATKKQWPSTEAPRRESTLEP
jgi:hypothetical protein